MTKKKYTLDQLLDFVNRFSTENTLSWSVPSLYRKTQIYEIHWIFDRATEKNWYVKKQDENDWQNLTASELLQLLIDKKCDLTKFELFLLKDICIQAVCAHYFIEKASDLIGKDKVDAAIQVMAEITKKVEIEKSTPKLKLVEQDDEEKN